MIDESSSACNSYTRRWLDELNLSLNQLKPRGLLRNLKVVSCSGPMIRTDDGRELVNMTSNSYLALNDHPEMKQAVVDAANRYGTGAGASLLISGHWPIHEQTERDCAAFKHAEAALLTPTGYMANLAVLTALAGPGDLICLDKLCHASLIDAARASGAEVRTYPHLKTDKLRRLLQKHLDDHACGCTGADRSLHSQNNFRRAPRRFIVTDSVFSMDGDCADLRELCDLAEAYDAIVLVDEAHGTGVLGETGAGLCEAQGVSHRVHVTVGTASKALGSLGGIITAARPVIETIVNHARSVIYTTAMPPVQAASIRKAVELIQRESWRRQRLRELTMRLHDCLRDLGWPMPQDTDHVVPIIPLIVGETRKAIELAEHLHRRGYAAPAIRPPTVPPGGARVRLSLRADMQDDHIDGLVKAIRDFGSPVS
ncbi:MAG: 8-amino-7-oxononanoate synthase [Phycisphaeraceae bacterium]